MSSLDANSNHFFWPQVCNPITIYSGKGICSIPLSSIFKYRHKLSNLYLFCQRGGAGCDYYLNINQVSVIIIDGTSLLGISFDVLCMPGIISLGAANRKKLSFKYHNGLLN